MMNYAPNDEKHDPIFFILFLRNNPHQYHKQNNFLDWVLNSLWYFSWRLRTQNQPATAKATQHTIT